MVSTAFRTIVAALVLAALTTPESALGQRPKVRLAVLGFENNSADRWWGDKLGAAATDELTTQLVSTGAFTVIERERLDRIVAEQNLGQSGRLNPATVVELGKILGVQAVLMGSITQFSVDRKSVGLPRLGVSFAEAETVLDVRVVNTSTGEIMLVAEGDGKKRFGGVKYKRYNFERDFDSGVAQEALRPAVEKAVKQIARADGLRTLEPLAAVANVVWTRGNSVYIDRGANFGVQVGARYAVFGVVDEIKDAHGNVLDRVVEQIGVIEVTQVLSQSSICRIVQGRAEEGNTAKRQALKASETEV